jgi:hypothetical protein
MSSNNPLQGGRPEPEPQRSPGIQRINVSGGPADSEVSGSDDGGTPPQPPKSGGSSSNLLVKLLVLVVLALGGWYFFGRSGGSIAGSEEASPMYQQVRQGPSATPAPLSAADIDRAKGDAAQQAAQRGDPIPGVSNATPEFVQAVKDGKVTFYAVRLYDTCFEDGDVVTLRLGSGADVGPIPLTNAGTTITVPIVAGQPPQVTVLGIKDGTGGITVGVQTSGGMWYSGVIPEGGSETMPLAVR